MKRRRKKTIRLEYWGEDNSDTPHVTFLDDPREVRISAGPKSFISVHEDMISISGGQPSKINIQGLSNSMNYAGMIQDRPFPLTLIPSTIATPFPQQVVVPPFKELLPLLKDFSTIASSFVSPV